MKQIAIILLLVSFGCQKQTKSSFDKFYLIEYSWQMVDLPEGEAPPRFQLLSYVEYRNDLTATNANRENYNAPIEFHKIDKLDGSIDSLSRVSNIFTADTTFLESDSLGIYDGPSYAFLIVKKESEVLVSFLPEALPQNLNFVFGISKANAHNQLTPINGGMDTTELKTKFEKIIKERSHLPMPPPLKTLKFVAPKILSRDSSRKSQK